MQNINNLNVLSRKPTLIITHEGLQAIKHIVSIAPQEAQWFHTVEPVEYDSSPGEIFLKLSQKLYIPKQNTSAAQVDSTSEMMIDFYNELKSEYQDQALVNQKLTAMTCWCHSHHNMSPNPSNQDDLQFNSFVSLAEDQSSQSWQIMLIFNKKDSFYSRVWDPTTGIIYEGVDIILQEEYDFSYINKAAKEKFLKRTPALPKKSKSGFYPKHWFDYKPKRNSFLDTPVDNILQSPEDLYANEDCALEIFQDLFTYERKDQVINSPISKFTLEMVATFYNAFLCRLDTKEIMHFIYLCNQDYDSVLKTFSAYGYSKYGLKSTELQNAFNNLFTDKISMRTLYENCVTVLDISECATKKEVSELLFSDPVFHTYNKLTK